MPWNNKKNASTTAGRSPPSFFARMHSRIISYATGNANAT